MSRYDAMFARLADRHEGAFIPFVMLGDPSPAACATVLKALVAGGADALELGIPFSDPVADGPVIQAAAVRALAAGTRLADCWALIRQVRDANPDLPIGLLVYANLVAHRDLDAFYGEAAAAGVDSVLVADLPVEAATEFIAVAKAHGIAPVFIAPPNADDARLARIAAASKGYTYVVTREGVTGADDTLRRDSSALLARLKALGAPPPVLGFGISTPEHVRQGLAMGAAGVISGSAVVRLVAEHRDDHAASAAALTSFVSTMKSATKKES
ncbi:MAG: tryptophan synthase subunit alpha [Gemmatimonadales bacterium]